jgi:hypothetical protein
LLEWYLEFWGGCAPAELHTLRRQATVQLACLKAIEDRTNTDQDEKKKPIATVSERLGERSFGQNSLLDLIVLDCY